MKITSEGMFKSFKTETNSVKFISLRKTLKTPFPLAYSRISICKGTFPFQCHKLKTNCAFVLREQGCVSSSLRGYFRSDMCLIENLSLVPALSKVCMMQSILFFVLTICDDHKREYK